MGGSPNAANDRCAKARNDSFFGAPSPEPTASTTRRSHGSPSASSRTPADARTSYPRHDSRHSVCVRAAAFSQTRSKSSKQCASSPSKVPRSPRTRRGQSRSVCARDTSSGSTPGPSIPIHNDVRVRNVLFPVASSLILRSPWDPIRAVASSLRLRKGDLEGRSTCRRISWRRLPITCDPLGSRRAHRVRAHNPRAAEGNRGWRFPLPPRFSPPGNTPASGLCTRRSRSGRKILYRNRPRFLRSHSVYPTTC